MPSLIEIHAVEKTYRPLVGRSKRALQGVDLEVAPGEVLGLIGPNGAGKTTLMTCLLGLQRPTRGRIRIDGLPPDDLAVRERTGYLPERLGFDRDLTGREFLTLHARLAGVAAGEVPRAVEQGASSVELAPDALRRRLRTYSRGMVQRIGLAQALLGRPSLLFLDEPTSGMDPAGVALVRHHVLQARGAGATVVLNSHQLPEVERLCDRVAFLEAGRVTRIESLRAEAGARQRWTVRVGAGREEEACAALGPAGLVATAGADGDVRLEATDAEAERVAPALVGAGNPLLQLTPAGPDLERLFKGPKA